MYAPNVNFYINTDLNKSKYKLWPQRTVLNSGISYCQLYAMLRKRIVSLELGRIICIIADDCMDDPLFVPRNIIDDGDVLTARTPQGSCTNF